MKKTLFFLSLLVLVSNNLLFAVMAKPGLIEVGQSDSTMLSLYLYGDEKVHWGKTTDGYTLMIAKTGDFVYAIPDNNGGIEPSEWIAHNPEYRSSEEVSFLSNIDKDLFYSREQIDILKQIWDIKSDYSKIMKSSPGREYRMIVILMEFPNLQFVHSREHFDNLFNQIGFNLNGNEGSVRDYFNASLMNKYDIVSTVVGPYTSANMFETYGQAQSGHSGARLLLMEGLYAADADVDYNDFCNNSNFVDCVFMIYAGFAQSGGSSNTIWPHRSRLAYPLQLDGAYIFDYACASEREGSQWYPQSPSVGTICHEFSHVLGLADSYDTDYDLQGQAPHPGEWDLMASGNYNNGGKCPPLWSAFQREVIYSVDMEELPISGHEWNGNKTLPPLHSENKAYKMSFSPTEYFILENRQQVGWDRFLPGHGMLIFHVDRAVPGWYYNCMNCNPDWMGYNLMAANHPNIYNRSGNPFPGTSNNTSFTDQTTPNSLSNSNQYLGRPIERIKENSSTGNISFEFGGINPSNPFISSSTITKLKADSIIVNINISPGSANIIERGVLTSYNHPPNSANNKEVYSGSSNSFSVLVSPQSDMDSIYIRAFAKDGQNKYYYGEVFKLQVPYENIRAFPYSFSFEDEDYFDRSWTEESNTYLSNKWRIVSSGEFIPSASHNDSFVVLETDSNNVLTKKLITPSLSTELLSQPYLSFDYYLRQRVGSNESIRIYYKTEKQSTWSLLKTINSGSNDWARDSILLPNKSSDYYIAFEGRANHGYGIGIDNIIISEANEEAFPQVETIDISDIKDISAKVSARIIDAGFTDIIDRGIVWSQNQDPTILDNVKLSEASVNEYEEVIDGLLPNTRYYFRAFAKNQGLIGYGNEVEIITQCERIKEFEYWHSAESHDTSCYIREAGWEIIDGIASSQYSKIYGFEADANGDVSKLILPIINLENYINSKLYYSFHNPGDSDCDTLRIMYKTGSSDWTILKTISNANNQWKMDSIELPNPQNDYYIAFEAVSNGGNGVYINEISIDAIFLLPRVETLSASLVEYNKIDVEAEAISQGESNITERGICFAINKSQPRIEDNKISSGNGLGSFSVSLSNLEAETRYNIRSYAINTYGVNYGEEFSIITPPTPIFNNIIVGDQELCYNEVTSPIYGSELSGGNNQFTYLWLESNDSLVWLPASDEDFRISDVYHAYRALETSYFKRVVYSRNVSDTSNIITKRVYPKTKPGNVFRCADTTNTEHGVEMELRTSIGDVLLWERRRGDNDWEEVFGKADSIWIHDSPQNEGLYHYRALVKSGVCEEGYSGEDWIYVKEYVGLSGIEAIGNEIIVSPNPNKGIIRIRKENNKPGDLFIYKMDGQEVYRKNNPVWTNNELVLDIGFLSPGSYLVVIKEERQINSKLIIKE